MITKLKWTNLNHYSHQKPINPNIQSNKMIIDTCQENDQSSLAKIQFVSWHLWRMAIEFKTQKKKTENQENGNKPWRRIGEALTSWRSIVIPRRGWDSGRRRTSSSRRRRGRRRLSKTDLLFDVLKQCYPFHRFAFWSLKHTPPSLIRRDDYHHQIRAF